MKRYLMMAAAVLLLGASGARACDYFDDLRLVLTQHGVAAAPGLLLVDNDSYQVNGRTRVVSPQRRRVFLRRPFVLKQQRRRSRHQQPRSIDVGVFRFLIR